jgi:hypothetical protein
MQSSTLLLLLLTLIGRFFCVYFALFCLIAVAAFIRAEFLIGHRLFSLARE